MQKQNQLVARFLQAGVVIILLLIPFHALLTAWFASNFGFFDPIRIWKEVILLVLVSAVTVLVFNDKSLRHELKKDRLVWLTGGFVVWVLLMTLIGVIADKVSLRAAAYGLIIDTRFFVFMLVTLLAVRLRPTFKNWPRYILVPAVIVLVFGLLQTVLPNDFLRHFGYGNETLPAFQAVDNKPGLARLQSTLRGPNPLGAYLIPVLVLLVAQAIRDVKKRRLYILGCVATLLVLFGTYSRSAWLGAIASVWLLIYLLAKSASQKKLLYSATAGLVIIASVLVVGLRNNDYIQNIAFHTNELSGSSTSSNQQRGQGLKNGLNDIYKEPLGGGVGSAGPASLSNTRRPGRISENFFIQIAQETGVAGLILFLVALAAIIKRLAVTKNGLAQVALASLVGLIIVNLITHAWADDTLAYVLFGLVGMALGFGKSVQKAKTLRYTKA